MYADRVSPADSIVEVRSTVLLKWPKYQKHTRLRREAYCQLFGVVHQLGCGGELMGVTHGLKAYLNAYYTESGLLRILTEQVEPRSKVGRFRQAWSNCSRRCRFYKSVLSMYSASQLQ